jgi:hypothetical protein
VADRLAVGEERVVEDDRVPQAQAGAALGEHVVVESDLEAQGLPRRGRARGGGQRGGPDDRNDEPGDPDEQQFRAHGVPPFGRGRANG